MIKIIADEKKGNTKIEANGMMGQNIYMLFNAVEGFFVECMKGLPSELQHKFIEDLEDSFGEILENLEDIADGEEDKEDEEDGKKDLPKEVIEAAEKTAKEMFEAMLKKAKEQADGDK